MAGVTKKVERIPPHLPQASSASSQARALSLSFLLSLPTTPSSALSITGAAVLRPARATAWNTAEQERRQVVGTPPRGVLSPFFLSLSLSLSLHLLPSALPFSLPPARPFEMGRRHSSSLSLSLHWHRPSGRSRSLHPSHGFAQAIACHPPSTLHLSLPLFLLPLSPLLISLSLSLSLPPFSPLGSWFSPLATAAASAQAMAISRHRRSPSLLLLSFPLCPPLLSPLRLDGHRAPLHPSLAPPPRMQPKGRGAASHPGIGHAAALYCLSPLLSLFLPLSPPSLLCSLSIVEAGDAGEGSPYFTNHTAPLFPQFVIYYFIILLFYFIFLYFSF